MIETGNNGNKKGDWAEFSLLCVETKERLRISKFILTLVPSFLISGFILMFFVSSEAVPRWVPLLFVLVAIGSLAYNHFNLKRVRKVMDRRFEILDSFDQRTRMIGDKNGF